MNTMSFGAPWGVFPTDVSSPMPSQVRGPEDNQKPNTETDDTTKKPSAPERPQK